MFIRKNIVLRSVYFGSWYFPSIRYILIGFGTDNFCIDLSSIDIVITSNFSNIAWINTREKERLKGYRILLEALFSRLRSLYWKYKQYILRYSLLFESISYICV